MAIKKLVLILGSIFFINIGVIYVIFYYNPIYHYERAGGIDGGVTLNWSEKEDKIAFLKQVGNKAYISVYELKNKKINDYYIGDSKAVRFRESVSFSPDTKKIAYIITNDGEKTLSIFDFEKNTILDLRKKFINPKISFILNSNPIKRILWLDNDRLAYESSIPFERFGISVINFKTNREELFIDRGENPNISHDKKKLIYSIPKDERKFDINIYDLEKNNISTVAENVKGFPNDITWSPKDKKIIIDYLEEDEKREISLNRVAVIYEYGKFFIISATKMLSAPSWVDEDNFLLAEFRFSPITIKVKSIEGLYLYNLQTKEYRKVSSQIRTDSYYVSPGRKVLISSFGKKGIYVLNINRLFTPLLIDKIRDYLGIVSM